MISAESRWATFGPPWLVGILIVLVYGPLLTGVVGSWFDPNADMGHGLAVPLVAAYMAWSKREVLRRTPVIPYPPGLMLLAWSAIQFTVCIAADWVFAARYCFILSLVGCVWTMYGTQILRELAYPLSVLILMITPPTFLQERVTFPLQLIASRMAETSLDLLGYSVLREGNILELVGERLAVAEACSGIRSLYSLIFFGVTYNYFFVRTVLARWVLLLAIVPLALLGNALRIIATGVVGQYNRTLAHGILHETWGYITIFLAAGFLVALHLLILRGERSLASQHA